MGTDNCNQVKTLISVDYMSNLLFGFSLSCAISSVLKDSTLLKDVFCLQIYIDNRIVDDRVCHFVSQMALSILCCSVQSSEASSMDKLFDFKDRWLYCR